MRRRQDAPRRHATPRWFCAFALCFLVSGCFGSSTSPPTEQEPTELSPVNQPTQTSHPGDNNQPSPSDDRNDSRLHGVEPTFNAWRPHAIVGVIDTGLNIYHQSFFRPNATIHPCLFIPDFPCLPTLNLSVGGADYAQMLNQDADALQGVKPDTFYWIPRTAFVAVGCSANDLPDRCFLPTSNGDDHATSALGAISQTAPDVFLAFYDGSLVPQGFTEHGIPIDVLSQSLIPVVPTPIPQLSIVNRPELDFLWVQSAGNRPSPTLISAAEADPRRIVVGGADDNGNEEAQSSKIVDVVSHFCLQLPVLETVSGTERRCGTSFSAPVVAGALAKIILEVRLDANYSGNRIGDIIEPSRGMWNTDIRTALNLSASYQPSDSNPETTSTPIPLNPVAPWTQWGWGFFDTEQAAIATSHLLGRGAVAPHPPEAVAFLEMMYEVRSTMYGGSIPP